MASGAGQGRQLTGKARVGAHRIDRFLELMNDRGASDLHFCVGQAPTLRLAGRTEPVRYRALTDEDFESYLSEVAPKKRWQEFKVRGDVDFAYEVAGLARFRVSCYQQQRGAAAVFRVVPWQIPSLDQLSMPEQTFDLTRLTGGLVIVAGPSGSGKTTTLAAIVSEINSSRPLHIVTVEDPVEFVHHDAQALVTQREVGVHVKTFGDGIRAAMREDPNVLVVGELRDADTLRETLNAAAAGLLVYGSLNTNSCAKAVRRIINTFPPEEQQSARALLADVLRGAIAQQLLPRLGGGRIPAAELLFGTAAMAQLIRDGKTHQITGLIQMGKSQQMVEMDEALLQLCRDKLVEPAEAYQMAIDKKDFNKKLRAEFGISFADEEDDPFKAGQ